MAQIKKMEEEKNLLEQKIKVLSIELEEQKKAITNVHDKDYILELFKTHVKDQTKTFDTKFITHIPVYNGYKLIYNGDGVLISIYKRSSWRLGDYDTFMEVLIMVDGRIIYENDS